MSLVRAPLKELARIATDVVGGCRGIGWDTQHLDAGAEQFCFRLVYVLFRSTYEAERYHAELTRRDYRVLPRSRIRELTFYDHDGWVRGIAAVAVTSPDPHHPTWFVAAPVPPRSQPGTIHAEARRLNAPAARATHAWWEADEHHFSSQPTNRLSQGSSWDVEPDTDDLAWRTSGADAWHDMRRFEQQLNAQFRKRHGYFQSVQELFNHCRNRKRDNPAGWDDPVIAATAAQSRARREQARPGRRQTIQELLLELDRLEIQADLERRRVEEDQRWQELRQALTAKGQLAPDGSRAGQVQ